MKKFNIFLMMLLVVLSPCKGFANEKKTSSLTQEEIERLSRCMGNLLWQNLNDSCSHYDFNIVLQTMKELSTKQQMPMNIDECCQIMEKSWEKLIDEEAYNNLLLAEQFLGKIANQPNIKEIQAGKLYYEILKEGEGLTINEQSSPTLHFKESDLSGSTIRDTYIKSPIKINLAETILGFSKGICGMQVGEKRKIYVHPDLAYGKFEGEKSQQLLIFEIEIISN